MKELKCPKCGNVFQVDEADYASIVNQVKNAEFAAEIAHRMDELNERQKKDQELAVANLKQNYLAELNKKEVELEKKAAEISRLKSEKDSEGQRLYYA